MANPTTNFSWVMPTSASLVTNLPADFAVFGQGVDTSMQYLLGGTTGQVLSKTSGTNMAFTWIANDQGDLTALTAGTGISVTSPTGPIPTVAIDATVTTLTGSQTLTNKTLTSPALTTPTISTLTTAGDLLVGTGSGGIARVAGGTSGYILTSAGATSSPTWAAAAGGGKVLQVVFGSISTEKASSTSTFVDTDLTATITPTLATSKILVLVSQNSLGKNNDSRMKMQLLRGATVILKMADALMWTNTAARVNIGSASASYYDAPATTSATTYTTQFASQDNNASVTVQQYISDSSSGVSTITLLEIGA